MTDISDKERLLKQQLDRLSVIYAQELPSKIAEIQADWQCLQTQPSEPVVKELIRKVHSLRGSGATFGFPAISGVAQRLEEQLRIISMNNGQPFSAPLLDALIAELENAAFTVPGQETGSI